MENLSSSRENEEDQKTGFEGVSPRRVTQEEEVMNNIRARLRERKEAGEILEEDEEIILNGEIPTDRRPGRC